MFDTKNIIKQSKFVENSHIKIKEFTIKCLIPTNYEIPLDLNLLKTAGSQEVRSVIYCNACFHESVIFDISKQCCLGPFKYLWIGFSRKVNDVTYNISIKNTGQISVTPGCNIWDENIELEVISILKEIFGAFHVKFNFKGYKIRLMKEFYNVNVYVKIVYKDRSSTIEFSKLLPIYYYNDYRKYVLHRIYGLCASDCNSDFGIFPKDIILHIILLIYNSIAKMCI